MLHRVLDLHTERFRRQLVKCFDFPVELYLLGTLLSIVEEFRAEIIHDEVANLDHVIVDLFFTIQQFISYYLLPRHIK